jgi:Cytokinin dehydrogenase 1, FAD and cytokinin binding
VNSSAPGESFFARSLIKSNTDSSPRQGGSVGSLWFPVAAGRYSKGRDNCYAFVADPASFSVQLLRQGSEAYNPATFFACSGQECTMKTQVSCRQFTKLAIGAAIVGKRYAPYSMVISSAEWQAHYGPEVWPRLVAAKAKYDPNRVLSPHPAIFAEK